MLSSREREDHREWIGGRIITLLSHFYRPDDPIKLTAAIGKDWADVLDGLPREAIQKACVQWMREQEYKPKPGDIYRMATASLKARRLASLPPVQRATNEQIEEYRASVARDRINPERKAEAEAIMVRFKTGSRFDGGS